MRKLINYFLDTLNITNQYRKEITELMAGYGYIYRL